MHVTISLDDDLLADAQAVTGVIDVSSLVQMALRTLVQRESARQLARLGGAEPDLKVSPRRRLR
jgi:Arc/MetJ family transcription regulator